MKVSTIAAHLSALTGQTVVEASSHTSRDAATTYVVYRIGTDQRLQLLAVLPGGSTDTIRCPFDERDETCAYHAYHEFIAAIEHVAGWALVVFAFEKPVTIDEVPSTLARDATAPIAQPPEGEEAEAVFVRDYLLNLEGEIVSVAVFRDTSIPGAYFSVTSDAVDLNATDNIYSPYSGAFMPMVGFT